jgi:hypothetical protein
LYIANLLPDPKPRIDTFMPVSPKGLLGKLATDGPSATSDGTTTAPAEASRN